MKRKRATQETKRAAKKRHVSESEEDVEEEEESEDASSSSEEDSPDERPKKKTKAPPRPKPAKVVQKAAPQVATSKRSNSEDSSLSEIASEEVEVAPETKPSKADEDAGASSSEESVVIDEPVKSKRQSKGNAPKPATKSKPAKTPSELSPDEAEIKKLQGQLLKCGIRKIWAFELRQHGENAKAKIRHLRGLLQEVGMDGRFSEAKAREIKERRELEADLEAVQEMNQNWGVSGARSSRSRAAKSMKEPSDEDQAEKDAEEQNDDNNDSGSDVEAEAKARGRGSAKYRSDFAFLADDDEESDSD